ncbi:hypothetical protein BASA81_005321 [Batrachochytrium salamandrivorans]|nr:hypothetical protein BASA81_005321 [Batrachochytrium salamandrivorans]
MNHFALPPVYLNLHVHVEAGRKAGYLRSAGTEPMHKDGNITIPHGYLLQSEFRKRTILAETRVEKILVVGLQPISQVTYQFSAVFDDGHVESGFEIYPSCALKKLNKALIEMGHPFKNFSETDNGALHMGVTYPNVQRLLHAVWEGQGQQLGANGAAVANANQQPVANANQQPVANPPVENNGSGDEGSGDEGSGDEGSGDEGSGDEWHTNEGHERYCLPDRESSSEWFASEDEEYYPPDNM